MQGDRQRALIIAETAAFIGLIAIGLSLIHISEPTRPY